MGNQRRLPEEGRAQRPYGERPDRAKVQSTPLINIGKPRVERIAQDIPSLAVKGKSSVMVSALTMTPQSPISQVGRKTCLLENIQWKAGKEETREEMKSGLEAIWHMEVFQPSILVI